jgi:hypothetical protein
MLRTCSIAISGHRGFANLLFVILVTVNRASASPADVSARQDVATQLSALASQFEEPLVPTNAFSRGDDEALLQAIHSYRKQTSPDDFGAFVEFLATHPTSRWRVAVLTNLGLSYYRCGYFSRAIDAWELAWREGKTVTERRSKALVDRAVGELARMHARLGHQERLATLFKEIGSRQVTGPATEALTGAMEGLSIMRGAPGIAYLCGPMALKNLLLSQGASIERVQFIDDYRSGVHGVSLAQVAGLAEKAQLPHRLIFRSANQPIPVPSIVHWKVSHFAAIIGEQDGRFHIQDPTFGNDLWMTRAALESESSGYFLVPGRGGSEGWRAVSASEANQVRGVGYTSSNEAGATKTNDIMAKSCPPSSSEDSPTPVSPHICDYNITEMAVSLHLVDTPVGYAPPVGPSAYVTLTYNQREAGQPANFGWFNVSPKWTLNWLAYIEDDPFLHPPMLSAMPAGAGA